MSPFHLPLAGGGLPPGLEAGSTHRRLYSWRPNQEHVNSLIRNAGDTVQARARWLARNNGYAKAALRSWRAATVGPGIKPSSLIVDRTTREAVNQAWLDWTDEADAEDVTDLYGVQRRVTAETFLVGESFVRLRKRRKSDGFAVPLQLQVMPSEQLPLFSPREATSGGNRIRLGIEFDARIRSKRVAYWFYRQPPGDTTYGWRDALNANLLTRVPADEVLHVFDPGESGQIRGLTSYGAAMVKMFHLDLYDDAELERKKQAARYAAVITSEGDMTAEVATELDNIPIAPYGPGAYLQLNPGEDIKFSQPAEVGGSYEPFQYRTLLAICAALGIPYSEVTADLQKTSYASSRAGLVAYRMEVEAFQNAVLIFQFQLRVWRAWMNAAVLAGVLPISATEWRADMVALRRAKFITPRLPWVDPWKDGKAEETMVLNGFKSRGDVIESLGSDPEETDRRIAEDHQREAELGLSFPVPASNVGGAAGPGGGAGSADETGATTSDREDAA
jgi:lambda family phage portal protein